MKRSGAFTSPLFISLPPPFKETIGRRGGGGIKFLTRCSFRVSTRSVVRKASNCLEVRGKKGGKEGRKEGRKERRNGWRERNRREKETMEEEMMEEVGERGIRKQRHAVFIYEARKTMPTTSLQPPF